MRGLQKSKRVSWASDLNLCQVKLFLSEECPSQVGLSGQDHLQAKASWPSQSTGAGSDDNLPPGFEGIQPSNLLQNKLPHIPVVEWKCPPRFEIDPTWQVAAGEESKEIELESQREMRVLEAVYPRPSAIPPNPAFPVDEPYYNDQHTPLIPITPIEDEDMAADTSATAMANSQTPATMGSHSANVMPPAGMVPGVEPDIVSAAYSALNAAMSNSSQGSLIDPNLLIKILSNPTLIEKLVSAHGASLPSQQVSQPVSMPMSAGISLTEPPPPTAHLPYSMAASSSGSYYPPPPPPPPSRVGPVPIPGPGPVSNLRPPPPPEVNPVVPPPPPHPHPLMKKDINYYKSLIQQHGGEKPEPVNNPNPSTPNPKPRDMKPKIMKPCIYFNSSRGCRHGANCVFMHDSTSQQRVSSLPEAQTAKRMKMDREITGT